MIRLLLVIPTLDRSGAEKQFTLLATRLPKEEFEVRVVCLNRGGPFAEELAEAGIPVRILHKRSRFDPVNLYRLKREISSWKPDVVHSWLFAANTSVRLVSPARRTWRNVVSERCVDSWKSGWQLMLDRKLASRTDALVGNSRSVVDFYRGCGYPENVLHSIPNAIIPREGTPPERSEFLKRWGLPADARLVACVGRLAPQKRIEDLLWGFQVLRQGVENAYFLIIGDGPERGELELHARNVECAAKVRFLGHQPNVTDLLPLFDVFWLGSSFEGMSNSLMEAMCAGVPVVVSDIPANRELVEHDRTGYLIPVGDGVGFAQFAARILGDEGLARRLGEAARAKMRTEYSVERMVESYGQLYRGLKGS